MNDALMPWQQTMWQRVCRLETSGCLPHALLLSGARGLGKRRFASTLVRWLLCDEHLSNPTPCGNCRGCHLADAGSHPDLSRLEPEEDKTTISVERVRALIAYVQLTPSHNSRKLVLLEEGDRLGTPAANTLLKVLEEPPGDALFVIVADRAAALPVTIRSRCQRLASRPPPTPVARAWLLEQGVDAEVDLLLEMAGGAPLRALELARSEFQPVLSTVDADIEQLLAGRVDPVRAARRWSKLPLPETVAAVHSAVTRHIRTTVLRRTDASVQSPVQTLDSKRLFDALDECAQVRALVERRTLSPNEQVMAAQRLALACALAGGTA